MKTGIEFFDETIIREGFPEGSLIIVAGEPGTGKTIFTSTIIHNGLEKFGEKGMYISLSETKEDFYDEMKRLGMDFEKYEKSGLFRFMDLVTVTPDVIEKEIELIMKEILSFRPKRIVIDSITALTQLLGTEKTRIFLHTTLGRFIKSFGAVAFLIAEKPLGKETIGHGVEEFVVDGVIVLKYISLGEVRRRVMEIPKMRKRSIEKSQYEYVITDRGIEFLAIPDLIRGEEDASEEKVSTGIKELDAILDGGVYRGSITLIVGMTGTGKTTFGLHFAIANALQGRKAIYISFEESVGQLKRAARRYGMPVDEVLDKTLKMFSWVPEAKTPVHTFLKIREIIDEHMPEVLVIDSLTSLREHMNEIELEKMLRYLSLIIKQHKVATYITLNAETDFETVPFTKASTLSDNIIGLKYVIKNELIERRLAVIKARGSNHSRKIHKYDITDKGVMIYE
ncbi:ATPase domain-containing protein [Thermococcus sp. SY098]|uniref:ATPase domain-containing protein n=1 Tax=Thermococcus sp. SY098 TaxID=3111325 RepID=UPI002D7741A0|nr:ATPase domain-containing protein [Thermococcus sp. SY098]WRS53402.1 ATPase domain-containing protein [Thermococcus sp. SY098]